MKGHVPTSNSLVDEMVAKLFADNPPSENDRILDPGCGGGAFIAGVLRWCEAHHFRPPQITGVELNPSLVTQARRRFAGYSCVKIVHADYLQTPVDAQFRYVIGNPPYVSLANLGGKVKRDRYRVRFASARGRFDLYMLFFERALEDLDVDGRLVFVTPEKFLYVASAENLRRLIRTQASVNSIDLAPEDAFPGYTAYPAVTTLSKKTNAGKLSAVRLRCGATRAISIPIDGQSWWPGLMGDDNTSGIRLLGELCVRISAGIATGADRVYVHELDRLPEYLRFFAKPAIAGKDLTPGTILPPPQRAILVPYSDDGKLLPIEGLGELARYLSEPVNEIALRQRACVVRKPWYAFHDNYPTNILSPKIVCKDITKSPHFWIDYTGELVPLHSVYYIVPKQAVQLETMCAWLNSDEVAHWLQMNCQRAANGYLRLQSATLRRLPIPDDILVSPMLEKAA